MTNEREAGPGETIALGAPSVVQWRLEPAAAEQVRATVDINPIPGVATTGFNAHGGEVMASPRVFAIYWGRDYGTPAAGMNARATGLDSFFSMVMTSRYLDMLGQYLVGQGTFLGSTWVDHDPGTAQTLTFDQMRDVLINWLDAGLTPEVPAWNERDLLFVIFPPTEVMLTDNDGGVGFCGYHWWGHYHNSPFQKGNLFFAVVDTTGGTDVVAHELAEAFTDRSVNGWFSDDGGGPEIGDVCSACGSQTLTLGGFSLASYWLVDAGRCLQQSDVTPAPPPPPPGTLVVTVAPPELPLNKATTFTITTVDNLTGAPVAAAHATVHNFTPHAGISGGYPVEAALTGVGSPITATVTFHAGRSIDDTGDHPKVVFDQLPSIELHAPGYSSVLVIPFQDFA
jgi:hypothetical protein